MRSGRKFSTKPMSAMPGRCTSATVISALDASDSDNSSNCNSSRWSSNRRATLIARTVDSVVVIRDLVLRTCRPRVIRAVRTALPSRCLHAPVLAAPHALLEPVRRELDRRAGVEVRLGDHHVLLVRTQRDLRRVQLALVRHDDAHLVDAGVVLRELLQPLLCERAHVGPEIAVTGGQVDLHGTLPRIAPAPPGPVLRTGAQRCPGGATWVALQATRRRSRAGRICSCSRYLATVR